MSDILRVQPFEAQLRRILTEYESSQSIFGIHRSLFYTPDPGAPYVVHDLFPPAPGLPGHTLLTPIGPAAGPHTQLSQNIVCAWLCGGRFIELKTVQVLDELEIPRPCIDMEDEGYNVEWSQELKLEQSAQEYINAWALVHILHRMLGWEEIAPLGTVFNMSIGYNLAGIRSPRVTAFMDRLADASVELDAIRQILLERFPRFADIEIPSRIVDSVTLSTMHGCPPDEIERIAAYLLEDRRLHTIVKLNPTLLGKARVLNILHDRMGFTQIEIPDSVFEHDLAYPRALELIGALQATAAAQGLTFGVKLSNTLAMRNHTGRMPGDEIYMSGRALYPVTMSLFAALARDAGDALRVSYSGGADALNVGAILACGALPVTACSDLLKPGGYTRTVQWLENLGAEMAARGAGSLAQLAANRLENVEQATADALIDPRYKKAYFPHGLPKVETGLGLFDCVVAPCVEACAVCQDVPEYAWALAQGDPDRALEVILARNPLPGVTGYVCNHLCQSRCTRNDYEETIAIRALKRYAEEHGRVAPLAPQAPTGKRVAVIGSGPSGFAAAFYLALNGIAVTMFEAKDVIGGMMRLVPVFRLPWEVIERDVQRILDLGVRLELDQPIAEPPETLLAQPGNDTSGSFDAVYVAAGFQHDAPLHIPGVEGPGVHAALALLDRTRRGERVDLGRRALVIGGGDTAMDAARTAQRLTNSPATIVYRRTRAEMPASPEELAGALEEGNVVEELATPVRIVREDGRVVGLACVRNALGEPGPDGRRQPAAIPGSDFAIPCDSVIVAVGQKPDLRFLDGSIVTRADGGAIVVDPESGRTSAAGVYAGGDAAEAGPESIIAACADGRRAAEAICRQLGVQFAQPPARMPVLSPADILGNKAMRARKEAQQRPPVLPAAQRTSFDLIELTLTEEQARREAARCVQCASYCDKCVEVCPNRALRTFTIRPVHLALPTLACRDGAPVAAGREPFEVVQERQIVVVNDFCNACGNCTTFCVHRGQPWIEKPRLFLNEADFRAETDNAFRIEGDAIRRREKGRETRLARADGRWAYESDAVQVTLTREFEVVAMALKAPFAGTLSLRDAAEMAVVFEGVAGSLPELARSRVVLER